MSVRQEVSIAHVAPFRVIPPHTGGRAVVAGACREWARRDPSFVCVALTTLLDRRARAVDCGFAYEEWPSAWSWLIGLERIGLSKVPYLWSFRRRVPALARFLNARRPDVVEVTLPWLHALRAHLNPSVKLVLCMQNIEAVWYEESMKRGIGAPAFRRALCRMEAAAVASADHVLTLTEQDRLSVHQRYGRPLEAISVSSPGMAELPACPHVARGGRVRAVFVGSAFSDNVHAARRIIREEAPRCADQVDFYIGGGVCRHLSNERLSRNVKLVGPVDDTLLFLRAYDIFVNPNAMRTGINVKVIDALAAGLRVVTTPEGARGYEPLIGRVIDVATLDEMGGYLRAGARMRPEEVRCLEPYLWSEIIQERTDLYRRLLGR